MARSSSLVSQYLENISGTALEEYQRVIRRYVRQRSGVYALYRRERLYYVGLASNLRSRLSHHLRDKHRGKWDRFSVYLTIGDSHLRELESLVLRIVRPKGNSQAGKFFSAENLRKVLARDMRSYYRQQLNTLLGKMNRDLRKVSPQEDGAASPR
jgi:DNA-binding transcriptional MocR family regulator